MNIRDLIEQLQEIERKHGDIEVRLAHQPQWAFEYSIDQVVSSDQLDGDMLDDEDDDEEPSSPVAPGDGGEEIVAYIGEGSQIGYLPANAARALGWGRSRR